jgi:hypothetical protein
MLYLAPLVPHHELSARCKGGQRQHERREHARLLLSIAVTDEEAAPVVDEQFVEVGRNRVTDAKPLGGQRNDPVERCLPVLAAKPHPIRPDLPCAPYVRIQDRCRAASIGGTVRDCDQLLGLNWKERQRDLTDAFNRQSRGQKLHTAGGIEVARPLNCAQ